jgi:hypothetical protein
MRSQASYRHLEGIVVSGDNNLHIFERLLRSENERGLTEFKRLGADMINRTGMAGPASRQWHNGDTH